MEDPYELEGPGKQVKKCLNLNSTDPAKDMEREGAKMHDVLLGRVSGDGSSLLGKTNDSPAMGDRVVDSPVHNLTGAHDEPHQEQ